MLRKLCYLVAHWLLWLSVATALPQVVSQSSQVSLTAEASPTGSPTIQDTISTSTSLQTSTPTNNAANASSHQCDFDSMQTFFDFSAEHGLDITIEVQNCQNLCLLVFGVGNPDLSGIGMMVAYTLQIILTILFGPVYRMLYLLASQTSNKKVPGGKDTSFFSFVKGVKVLQASFLAANGFFIGASAVASYVHLSQEISIFEVAEIQVMSFMQINSILVITFCMVLPVLRWRTRITLHTVVFILMIVVLGRSQLSGSKRTNWRLASLGCASKSPEYGVITPVLYPSWAVAIFAVAGALLFWLQYQKERFKKKPNGIILFWILMVIRALLIGLMTTGMVLGLIMMWRQRNHLRNVAGIHFEDDAWGFGQVAALFIWAPILVELLYIFIDRRSARREEAKREQDIHHNTQNEEKVTAQTGVTKDYRAE